MGQLSISQEVKEMIKDYNHEKLTPDNLYEFATSQASITRAIKSFTEKGLSRQEVQELRKFLADRVKIIEDSNLNTPVTNSMTKVIKQLDVLLIDNKPSAAAKKGRPAKMKVAKDYFKGETQKSRSSAKPPKTDSHAFKSIKADDALQGTVSRIVETSGTVRAKRSEADEMRSQAKIKEANLFFTMGMQSVQNGDRAGALKNLANAAFLEHPRALHLLGAHHLFEAVQLENKKKKIFESMELHPESKELAQQLDEISVDIVKSREQAQKQLRASADAGIEEAQALLNKHFPEETELSA